MSRWAENHKVKRQCPYCGREYVAYRSELELGRYLHCQSNRCKQAYFTSKIVAKIAAATGQDPETWLRREYVELGQAVYLLAKCCGVTSEQLKRALEFFGITPRTASEQAVMRWAELD